MAARNRPWLDETTKSSVPLTADQLEMLDCGLSSLTNDPRWSSDEINEVSDVLNHHRRYLQRTSGGEGATDG